MNLVNKVKNTWTERKFRQMEKDLIRIRQEMLAFRDQKEELQTGEMLINVDEKQVTPAINNESEKTMTKKTGYDEGGGSPCHLESDDDCVERIKKPSCNKHNRSLKEYRLREGKEREWIERIRKLMEKQHKKSLEQQLTELMPSVRYHQEIKNAIKAKRIAVRQKLNAESMNEFLGRLSELYGQDRNNEFSKKTNKKIKCNKCKKRGHLRKNCPKIKLRM